MLKVSFVISYDLRSVFCLASWIRRKAIFGSEVNHFVSRGSVLATAFAYSLVTVFQDWRCPNFRQRKKRVNRTFKATQNPTDTRYTGGAAVARRKSGLNERHNVVEGWPEVLRCVKRWGAL